MSFTKQFEQNTYPEGELKGKFPEPSASDQQIGVAALLGIYSVGMMDSITHDICTMIEKEQRYSLDGYVLCLSRILASDIAWECINRAFKKKSEPVPISYYRVFQKDKEVQSPQQFSPRVTQ